MLLTCPLLSCVTLRNSEKRSAQLASRGRCSEISSPGTTVGIGANSPRYSAGACGLRSKVSMWLIPPHSQSTISDLGARGVAPGDGADSARKSCPSESPASAAPPARRTPRRGSVPGQVRKVDAEELMGGLICSGAAAGFGMGHDRGGGRGKSRGSENRTGRIGRLGELECILNRSRSDSTRDFQMSSRNDLQDCHTRGNRDPPFKRGRLPTFSLIVHNAGRERNSIQQPAEHNTAPCLKAISPSWAWR